MPVNEILLPLACRGRAGLVLVPLYIAIGCGPGLDAPDDGTAGHDSGSGSSITTVATTMDASTTGPFGDASRFFGTFHNERGDVPFGRRLLTNDGGDVIPPLNTVLANVEIRPDGTAVMSMEWCYMIFDDGPIELEWRWELGQDGSLEFTPGSGEGPLRFIAPTELASLRATIDDECELRFYADGEMVATDVFRPGKACWVTRCDPPWVIHIDYCEGEQPPPCP